MTGRGERVGGWERRGDHQLDRFTFVRDDGEGGVIASGSDAIQLVVQEEAGLPRRFAPRNDGEGGSLTRWAPGPHPSAPQPPSPLWEREKVRVGGATKDFGRFRGGVVGGGVFVWASGFRAGGPVWGYLT